MKGWYGDRHKHSLASRGIKTGEIRSFDTTLNDERIFVDEGNGLEQIDIENEIKPNFRGIMSALDRTRPDKIRFINEIGGKANVEEVLMRESSYIQNNLNVILKVNPRAYKYMKKYTDEILNIAVKEIR